MSTYYPELKTLPVVGRLTCLVKMGLPKWEINYLVEYLFLVTRKEYYMPSISSKASLTPKPPHTQTFKSEYTEFVCL